MCPRTLCGRSDHYGNPEFNRLYERRERLEQTIAGLAGLRRGTFVFHHSLLPHGPWVYLPSGRRRTGPRAISFPEIAAPAGFGNPFLTRHLEQRHLLQAGFVDREVGRMVRMIKRSGQWRRALVVVAADHGMSFQVGTGDRRQVTPANVHEIAPVPLFIKRPGQTAGRVLNAYARTVDVLPTVAKLLGRRLPVAGRRPRRVRARGGPRAAVWRSSSATSAAPSGCPAREMELRRQADRGQRAALFGTGPWAGVFRIGPNRGLLGREVPNPVGGDRARAAVGALHGAPLTGRRGSGRQRVAHAGGGLDRERRDQRRSRPRGHGERPRGRGRPQLPHRRAGRRVVLGQRCPTSALRSGRNTMALFEVTAAGALVPLGVKR